MSNMKTVVEIGGDNTNLKKSISESTGLIGRFSAQMAAVQSVAATGLSNAAGGFASVATKGIGGIASMAATVGAAAIAMANNSARAANEVSKLAASSGLGAQEMAKLAYAFQVGGVSSQDLGQGLKGLTVKLTEAAGGNAEAQAAFKSLGVEIRDTSGKIRPVQDVLYDVAEAFKRMPDGAEKSALAIKLMEETGLKLIPVLNGGAAAIRKFGEEAENIGIVFTPEQIAAAKEWEQNLQRLKSAGEGVAHNVGNEIVPHMARLSTILLENKNSGLGWFESFMAMVTGTDSPAQRVADLTQRLSDLRAKQLELTSNGINEDEGLNQTIAATERSLSYFVAKASEASNAVAIAEEQSAKKRTDLERDLARQKAELAKYTRYIQTGEIGVVEANAKAAVDRQIADQQRLVDSVRNAWQQSRAEASKAESEAAVLSKQATEVRSSATDRATEVREASLPESTRQVRNASRALDALDEGRYYAAAAAAAQLDKRFEQSQMYYDKAKGLFDRAQRFADSSGRPDLIEDAGNQQASLLETAAKGKKGEAANLTNQAEGQAALLNELQSKLDALTQEARTIQVDVQVSEAQANIEAIQSSLAQLQDKTVTVTVNSVDSKGGVATLEPYIGNVGLPARAFGGPLPGRAIHDRSDNMLYWGTPGEWVIQRPAVRKYGVEFLSALNEMRLPKFANGGQLSAISRLEMPPLRSTGNAFDNAAGSTVVLDFGSLGRFETKAPAGIASEVKKVFRRASMGAGRRG